MRLIDADRIDFGEVFKGSSDFAKDTREAAQELIDNQPTAYDLDEVISQLKEKKNDAWDLCDAGARYSAYDNALDIVGSGIN